MNKEILRRYFEGKSSTWEKKQVKEYFQGEDMRVFDEYLKEQEKSSEPTLVTDLYKNKFYDALLQKIEDEENIRPARRVFKLRSYLKIAASLFLISGIGASLYLIRERQKVVSAHVQNETIINHSSNVKKIVMPDGTRIWLNPQTELSYDKTHFGDTSREVKIAGEAYFDVAHNVKKRFRVHSGDLTTTVLGTAFNVEAYRAEKHIRVLLVRGFVNVRTGNNKKVLLPGQMLDLNTQDKNIAISTVDVSGKQELFTSGKLVFENVALANVLRRLESIFGITFNIANKHILDNKSVSGYYFRTDPDDIINRILFMHSLRFKKKGENNYVITDQRTQSEIHSKN